MRHSPIPETSHDERLKERIRPLLSPCDGLSEPAMGQARLMRIVDRIRSAVTSMDIADRYGFSALWIKIGNCLRDESVAAGRSERFSLFMVALESALERLNASLFEFRGDTVIGLVSGLQGTRFARAIGELRFRHSDTPEHVAALDRYVALRERYDQCRDLLPRISELSLGSDPAMGHRALIVTDTGIIVAEKLDRACDDAALLDIFREMGQILAGVERIEDPRSLDVIRCVPGFSDIASPCELFSREEYLSILLQHLAARGASRRSERAGEYEFFRALSSYASRRLNQKKRMVRLAEGCSDAELSARLRDHGIERLYESARKALESRSAHTDIAAALRDTPIGRFVPNRYGLPVQRVDAGEYEIYGSSYSEAEVSGVLGNLGYFSMLGLAFILPTLPKMLALLRTYFPKIAFSIVTPLSSVERAKMLAGFLFVFGVDYPDGAGAVDASDLDHAEHVCLAMFENPEGPTMLDLARERWFLDKHDRIVMKRFAEFVAERRAERGLPETYE